MAATKWNVLFDEVPKFFQESGTGTDFSDANLLPIFNSEYIALHHETKSLFQKEAAITAASVVTVDITDLTKITGEPTLAANVIGIVIDDDNPILFYDYSILKHFTMMPARDRQHLEDYADYTKYVLQFPNLYWGLVGATSDVIRATLIFSGTETVTGGSDSTNSPVFQDELQPLGEKALLLRVVAKMARNIGDAKAQQFQEQADRATDTLAYEAARLIGGSVLREYMARRNAK